MIRLALDQATVRGVRIAISPLWESLSSLTLLARWRDEAPYPYTSWARHARGALPDALRTELLALTRELHTAWLPSFRVPIPTSHCTDIKDELSGLLEVQDAGPAATKWVSVRNGRRNPVSGVRLVRFAELVEDYWSLALEPYWASMRNALEEEILFRGRTLATEGADAVLADLGGRVRWEPPALSAPCQVDLDQRLENAHLLIVPVLFAQGTHILVSPSDSVAALSYQARGAVVLEENSVTTCARDEASDGGDRLAILLGRSRATVMRALIAPTTTTAVARAVGLAPSTVSQHLSALSAAGVVRRRRAGYRVLYELDHAGLVLLQHADAHAV
ncbi:MAG TPA: winged helix-turn-helix domain-containing protein [Pseudonocardiaceae bacterium]|nr:winged helix-turn-helix domain-containing protein [Pseudonocardiaceae bacterium]